MDQRWSSLADKAATAAGKAARKAGEALVEKGSQAARQRGLMDHEASLNDVVDGFRSLAKDGKLDKDEIQRRLGDMAARFRQRK